jgi:hypothetical protein
VGKVQEVWVLPFPQMLGDFDHNLRYYYGHRTGASTIRRPSLSSLRQQLFIHRQMPLIKLLFS